MLFEKFLKDLRQSKGLTQSELAELLFISEKTLSGYETSRRQCTFNFAMEILDKLNVSILVENNEIKLVKGDIIMTKNYSNNDLNFVNFNSTNYINDILEHRKGNLNNAKKSFNAAYKKLNDLGFETLFGLNFSEEYWMDENYPSDTKLATFTKDRKSISLIVSGYFESNMFIIERFIEKIEENHNKDIADFIFKSILYCHATQCRGTDIYNAFYRKDLIEILNLIPMLENYKTIIKNILDKYHDYIFVTIENGFNPSEISIANEMELYDCFSTPNLYFTYTMEDECEVIDYEDYFEGHDVADAFNYVNEYFKDYESYKYSYLMTIKADDDNAKSLYLSREIRDLTILN